MTEKVEATPTDWTPAVQRTEAAVVIHIQENQRYKMILERAASSTKGVDGFKVEANSDNLEEAKREVEELYNYAKRVTTPLSIAPALEK